MAAMLDQLELRRHAPRVVFILRDGFAVAQGETGSSASLLSTLTVKALGRLDGGTFVRLAPPNELDLILNRRGDRIWFGNLRSGNRQGNNGERRAATFVTDQKYRIRIESPEHAFAPFEDLRYLGHDINLHSVSIEPAHDRDGIRRITLEPGYAYPFRGVDPIRSDQDGAIDQRVGSGPTLLRGTFVTEDGIGREDWRVQLVVVDTDTGSTTTTTYALDASGQWIFALATSVFPEDTFEVPADTFDVTLRFLPPVDADQSAAVEVPVVTIVRGRETRFRQTSLLGLARGFGGEALSGVGVVLSGRAEKAITDDDGRWSIHFAPDVFTDSAVPPPELDVTATSPDGQALTHAVTPQARRSVRVDDFVFD